MTARSLRRQAADRLVREFSAHPDTIGVCLLSSLASPSLDYADEFSDIDLGLFLAIEHPPELLAMDRVNYLTALQPYLPAWIPSYRYTTQLANGADCPVDLFQYSFAYESQDRIVWPLGQIETYSRTCLIVFDRDHMTQRLILGKLSSGEPLRNIRRTELVAIIPLRLGKQVDRALARNRRDDVDLILRNAIGDILELAFLVRDRFFPTYKWAFRLLDEFDRETSQHLHSLLVAPITSDGDRARMRNELQAIYSRLCGTEYPWDRSYHDWKGPLHSGRQLRLDD